MKAIFIKELRENVKWAALLLLAIGAATTFAVYVSVKDPSGVPLLAIPFQMVTAIGFAAVGLTLGLLQSLQDSRRGRWAFVSHRPISRSRIFFGKVLMGLILYLLVTGIALSSAIAWIAAPGHVAAPYEWHMTLPAIADLLAGAMWYFAGLYVGSRTAKWFGSRLMPAGVAVLGSIGAMGLVWGFGVAMLVVGAGVVILLLGAWGSFVRRGKFENQPWLIRLLETLCVCCGVALAFGMVCGIGNGLIDLLADKGSQFTVNQYFVTPDGQIRKLTWETGGYQRVFDLQGRPIEGNSQSVANQMPSAYLWVNPYHQVQSDLSQGFRVTGMYAQRLFFTADTAWFYVQHRQLVQGYDLHSREYRGAIGIDGFTPAQQPTQPFDEPMRPSGSILVGDKAAYRIDQRSLQVEKIFTASANDPIQSANTLSLVADNDGHPEVPVMSYDVVATQTAIHVLHDGKELFKLPLPPEWSNAFYSVTVGTADGKRFFVHYQNWISPGSHRDQIVETDAHGKIVATTDLPAQKLVLPQRSKWRDAAEILPFPPALIVAAKIAGEKPPITWPLVASVSVLSGAAGWIITGCYAFKRSARMTWTLFAAAGGIGGVLALLAVRNLPPRVVCPNCRKRRVVDQDSCPNCDAPFPPPQHEGIEIFDIAIA